LIYGYIREGHPDWFDHISEKVSFDTSDRDIGIQTADLFAREAMKFVEGVFQGERPIRRSLDALVTSGRFKITFTSKEFFDSMRQNRDDVESYLGFSWEDYQSWLKRNNRLPSLTAYSEFVRLSIRKKRGS
jgi:hypothetical protein